MASDERLLRVQAGLDERITVSHLLRHTAGFTLASASAVRDPYQWNYDIYPNEITNRLTVINYALRYLNNDATVPGVKYEYSNIGYLVLGEIVERISQQQYGKSYEDYVKDHVLPGGTESMEIAHSAPDQPNQFNYHLRGEDNLRMELRDAAGGWMASAPDLLRFLIATKDQGYQECGEGEESCYRAGFVVNGNVKWHYGSNPGTFSFMKLDNTDQTSSVIIFNSRSQVNGFGAQVGMAMTEVMRPVL